MARFELVVLLEHTDGYHTWSRHRSVGAAHQSFREVRRQWPGDRAILIDLTTGERQQCDRDGAVSEAFRAPIYTGGRFTWIDR